MKNIYYICFTLVFVFSSVTFVSCGSDDEKINPENTASRDASGNIKITEVNFPDPVFRAYLFDKYGADGVLNDAEIDHVIELDLSRKNIKSLEGIEFFPLLEKLACSFNQLTSLDVSKNTQLIYLDCSFNQLTSLDVSKNTQLIYLDCSSNQLTSLDISQNTKLSKLNCGHNQLTSLDVSKNTELTELRCFSNQLTSLDVSRCTMLTQLECYVNQIKGESMDALVESLPKVSKGIMMVIYNANEQNVMTFTQVKAAKAKGWIPYYYPSNNWLKYDGIPITIDATNFPDEKFRNYLLSQNYGADGKLVATEIAEVSKIDVSSQEIQSLQGIEFFTALTELDCSRNQLASLDLSECTELRTLNCYYNQLTSLGISKNTALTELRCFSNQLTSLDVSKNTKLTRLWCGGNQLTSLDVFKNTAVTSLSCSGNQLTSLDVSNNTKLTELNCGHNQLTSLDVSKNTKLTELICDPGVNVTGWPK